MQGTLIYGREREAKSGRGGFSELAIARCRLVQIHDNMLGWPVYGMYPTSILGVAG